jgi:hypothetical protein
MKKEQHCTYAAGSTFCNSCAGYEIVNTRALLFVLGKGERGRVKGEGLKE